MGAVAYVVLLVGAIGMAIGLYYALRTAKLI